MIAASVVDLPEPVGPVTRTRPLGFVRELRRRPAAGRARRSVRILNGIVRNAPATAPRCMKMLARKRESPFTPNERSSSFVFSNCALLLFGEDRVAELLRLDRRRAAAACSGTMLPVDAQERRRAGRDVHVARPLLDHRLEELVEVDLELAAGSRHSIGCQSAIVTRMTSSGVVTPSMIFLMPLIAQRASSRS